MDSASYHRPVKINQQCLVQYYYNVITPTSAFMDPLMPVFGTRSFFSLLHVRYSVKLSEADRFCSWSASPPRHGCYQSRRTRLPVEFLKWFAKESNERKNTNSNLPTRPVIRSHASNTWVIASMFWHRRKAEIWRSYRTTNKSLLRTSNIGTNRITGYNEAMLKRFTLLQIRQRTIYPSAHRRCALSDGWGELEFSIVPQNDTPLI